MDTPPDTTDTPPAFFFSDLPALGALAAGAAVGAAAATVKGATTTFSTLSLSMANFSAISMACLRLAVLVPLACADSGLPPPFPFMSADTAPHHSLAFSPADTACLEHWAMQRIFPESGSELKKMVGVSGARAFTCFRAPSTALLFAKASKW